MKTPFLIIAVLVGTSEAFSTTNLASSRPASALKDAVMLDPIVQGGAGGVSDQILMAAGGAAAAAAAGLAAVFGNKPGSASGKAAVAAKPQAIDVSIPYNAAAMLAFKESKLSKSKMEEFESLYQKKTVADVTLKKMARDVEEMEKVAAKLASDLESL